MTTRIARRPNRRCRGTWHLVRALALFATVASVTSVTSGGPAGAATTSVYRSVATFSGPVTGGQVAEPLSAEPVDLAAHGYIEQEYFASGTAHAFRSTSSPSDGRWTVQPTTAATYRTRILVRRPSDPARFSGTVVVEWLNESAGESDPEWVYFNPELIAAGDAYVAVTTQKVGVDGGTPLLGSLDGGKGLVQQEPERYGSLHHPGDQYALDIFAQIGLGLRTSSSHVLGTLEPRHIVAVGESQSAFFLTTFADAVQPATHAFDGIFIHSRDGSGAPLDGASDTGTNGLSGDLRIRTDLGIPVFMFETQTDLIELGYARAQQPDTREIRTWEVAGTSHADAYLVGAAAKFLGCPAQVNDGPQHVVAQAAFAAFVRWVVHGTPPPSPPPFRLRSDHPPALALDRYGNVVGGVRTPAVDVPVSVLSGAAPPGASALCSLFGSTTPFSPQMLTAVYGTKAHYLGELKVALDRAVRAGYVLPVDKTTLLAQAREVQFPTG